MKIMPSIIIKIFTVMEIISHYEALARDKVGQRQVIYLVWIATLTLAMTKQNKNGRSFLPRPFKCELELYYY